MRIRRSSWQFLGVGAIAALGVVSAAVVPASAAPQRAHSAHATAKTHTQAYGKACKTRNKATGEIRYSDWQFPDSLNTYQTNSSASFETINTMIDPIVQFTAKGPVYPVLITKLPTLKNGLFRDGGKTVLASLKQGLKWSNGTEITSADVKFGFKIGSDPKSGPLCAGTCDVIRSIDTHGKYDLVFHLKHPYPAFVSYGWPPVWPTVWKGAWAKNNVAQAVDKLFLQPTFNFEDASYPTNGPYQITSFNKDDRIILHPMKYYTTNACGAHVAKLVFAFYSSKESMIAAAANHETDTTTDYTLADVPTLHSHSNAFKVHDDPGYLIEHLTYNLDKTYNGSPNPLSDTKVRQALNLAVDKYALIESALSMNKKTASGIIAWTPLIITKKLVQPFAYKGLQGQWDPIARKYLTTTGSGQALKDAKTLLSQSRFKGGFSIDGFTTTGNAVRQAQFSVVQRSWRNIGVNMTPNYVKSGKLFGGWGDGGVLQHGAFQMAMYADVGYPDPDNFKFNMQHQYIDREKTDAHSTTFANVAGIHDSLIDSYFNKAASTLDPKQRTQYYKLWQIRLNQQAYWLTLFYRGEIATSDSKLQGFQANSTNAGDEWNVYKWTVKGHT